jgi:SNF2 family DNA or RNA helicase
MKLEEYQWPSRYGKPFAHQVETVKFILRNPRSFILSEMGTGKTLSCLWATDLLRLAGKIKRVLIVSPLSTVHAVWSQSIYEHLPHRECVILIGARNKRIELLKKDVMYYVCNVDGVKVLEDELIKKQFDVIIIDEITAFGTHTSQRSKVMYNIARHCKAVIGLTATPTANTPLTAFSLAKIVNPSNPCLPRSFYKFRETVCEPSYDGYTWQAKEGHEKIVAKVLSPSIRYETRDCIDLPPTVYMDRDVELPKTTKDVYDTLKKDLMLEFKEGRVTVANSATKMLKLLQVSAGGVLDDEKVVQSLDCSTKIDEIINLFDENKHLPAIVSCVFTASVRLLTKQLKEKGYRVDYIDGSRTGGARSMVVQAMQNNELDFLVVLASCCSHGLTLTAANLLINFSPVYSNEVSEQLHARIIRPGQTRTQLIVNLISTPTEKRFFKALKEKSKLSDTIMAEFLA